MTFEQGQEIIEALHFLLLMVGFLIGIKIAQVFSGGR